MIEEISTKIALFKGKQIRKTLHNGEWWFSIVDVIAALTDSANPRVYWGVMKTRVENDEGFQLFTNCKQLKLASSDGKKYETDCTDTEGIFRLIQSIPSPKAEPFKRWLANRQITMSEKVRNNLLNDLPLSEKLLVNSLSAAFSGIVR